MATDDFGGISKDGSMPWPKNTSDLQWFKKNTLNTIIIMGRLTWVDPFMPSPLKGRINILVTNQDKKKYPGADEYLSGDILTGVLNLSHKYKHKDIFIIGGVEILNQLFDLIEEFYLTRIYGDYECDKKINLKNITESMQMIKKLKIDKNSHVEIWKK